jgi:hypothetical protein
LLPQVVSFKYLRVFFDAGLRWGTQARYVQKRCLQRLNFLKSIASVWWGAHPHCMIMLYRGLVESVLEYGSFCYCGMARTHMLRLERVQYRGIRIALELMCSTPNNSLGVLSGIAPLAERFLYMNFRYLVAVFYCLDHPLKRRLETLRELNLGRCIASHSDVFPLAVGRFAGAPGCQFCG